MLFEGARAQGRVSSSDPDPVKASLCSALGSVWLACGVAGRGVGGSTGVCPAQSPRLSPPLRRTCRPVSGFTKSPCSQRLLTQAEARDCRGQGRFQPWHVGAGAQAADGRLSVSGLRTVAAEPPQSARKCLTATL